MNKRISMSIALLTAGCAFLAAAHAQISRVPPRATRLKALPAGITEARIRSHVMAPAHVRGIEMEVVDESRERKLKIDVPTKTFKTTPKPDIEAFGKAVHAIFKENTTGYILQVRQNGNLVYNLIWNWAQTPADQNKGWNENTRMHVASVSKWLTAVGMVKALDSKGISYDAKIAGYLPDHWSKGNNVDKITFRHLLTHTSGFSTGGSSTDYAFMKGKVSDGVSGVGSYDYENMNFGLCRILIPIVMGNIDKDAEFIANAALNDNAWDAVTLHHYKNFMQSNVFSPAGVQNADFDPTGTSARAYKFPHNNEKGWNSGELDTVAGGAGWRLSTKELLNVMNHVRRRGTVVPSSKAQYILDNKFGIDQVIDTPAGKLYNKNGAWGSGGRKEQCVAYFMPHGVEVAVFVNSPIGSEDYSLRGVIKDAYINSLQD